jgi:hypothetical protein
MATRLMNDWGGYWVRKSRPVGKMSDGDGEEDVGEKLE